MHRDARAEPIAALEAATAAMELGRLAGILPAYMLGGDPAVTVSAADLAAWRDPAHLTIQSRARLPIEAIDEAEIVAFRASDDMREHVALILGRQSW